jgi:dimethylamine/trimethylamine dehydrogenase
MDGTPLPEGPVLVYDEDNYYMGGVIAEAVRARGHEVIYCTNADQVSSWAAMTSERRRVHKRLIKLGIGIELFHALTSFDGQSATVACEYSGNEKSIPAGAVVMVTQRAPQDGLYQALLDHAKGDAEALPFSLTRFGDCEAPAIVAAAVYAGHRYARELGETVDIDEPLKHDRIDVGETPEGRHLNIRAEPKQGPGRKYLETLVQYYEEEIEGEAYFSALADRLIDPEERRKMQMMADVETYAAASVRPLIDKYGLTPRPAADLAASGRASAAEAQGDFASFMAEWRKSFPAYMDDFHGLEAMAPAEDLPMLNILTNHETAAIAFLEREARGEARSTEPMERYLETGEA